LPARDNPRGGAGENVVAITSSSFAPHRTESGGQQQQRDVLLSIPTPRRNMFVIPFINIEIPKKER
jgi:hypothetical protein